MDESIAAKSPSAVRLQRYSLLNAPSRLGPRYEKFQKTHRGGSDLAAALGALIGPATAETVILLKVRVVSPDGKPTLRVKRKISFYVGCSRNCAVKVKLVMPAVTLPGNSSGVSRGNTAKSPSMTLNRNALRYLRQSFRLSRFIITATAKDIERTNKKMVKRKVFRFRLGK